MYTLENQEARSVTDVTNLPSTFTTAEAEALGFPRWRIYEERDRGALLELSRGVWRKSSAPETAHLDLLAVARRAPHGAICLLSALAFWNLTDEIPPEVHLAVPRDSTRPRISYPTTRVHVFDAATFELGIQQPELASGERIRIYGPARSVVDALRLRNQLGRDLAFAAARRLLGRERAAGRILELSRRLRCETPVGEALEILQA
jgi:predicted transcriptional regulator of viral defense system